MAGTLSHIVRTEGARALYSGIVPGLQRQMAFSAIRIGAYERVSGGHQMSVMVTNDVPQVKEVYSEAVGVTQGPGLMLVRIAAGMTTGTLAILAAQPTDVVKVKLASINMSFYIHLNILYESGCSMITSTAKFL